MRLKDLNVQVGDLISLANFDDELYVVINIDEQNFEPYFTFHIRDSTFHTFFGLIDAEIVFRLEDCV